MAPAAAVYVSGSPGLFRLDDNTNIRGNLSIASITIAEPAVVTPNTITLQTPSSASMSGNYSITFPTVLPAGDSFMKLSASGVISAVSDEASATDIATAMLAADADTIVTTSTLFDTTGNNFVDDVSITNDAPAFTIVSTHTTLATGRYLFWFTGYARADTTQSQNLTITVVWGVRIAAGTNATALGSDTVEATFSITENGGQFTAATLEAPVGYFTFITVAGGTGTVTLQAQKISTETGTISGEFSFVRLGP